MDILERFSGKFGKWYEGLFGSESGELRPKDVLRKIIAAMEDNRKEGFDSKIYVPNKYVLELAMDDPEERDYLLSFLDEEELVSVLKRFMAQHQYHIRGPLDFTVQEVPHDQRPERGEKLRVKVRFEKGELSSRDLPAPVATPATRHDEDPFARPVRHDDDDLATVAAVNLPDDDAETMAAVAWASLSISSPDGRKRHESLTRPITLIGRSRNAGNDLILSDDGQVSKQHARIERESDGRFTIYDLGSTNGVLVNGQRISGSQTLGDGDEIKIGSSLLLFQGDADEKAGRFAMIDAHSVRTGSPRRSVLVTPDGAQHILASETLIGRALTADIVLDSAGVSMRHARIISPDPSSYFVEDLGSEAGTLINGRPVAPRTRSPLASGDIVRIGPVELRFVGGAS